MLHKDNTIQLWNNSNRRGNRHPLGVSYSVMS